MNCCEEFEELINSYIDSEISDEDALRLKEHLSSCENCRNMLDAYSRIFLCERPPAPEVPESLLPGVMEKIKKEPPLKKASFKRIYITIAAAAACICLCFFGINRNIPKANNTASDVDDFGYYNGYSNDSAKLESQYTDSAAPKDSYGNSYGYKSSDVAGGNAAAGETLREESYNNTVVYIKSELPDFIKSPVSRTLTDGQQVIYPTLEELELLIDNGYSCEAAESDELQDILDGHFSAIIFAK